MILFQTYIGTLVKFTFVRGDFLVIFSFLEKLGRDLRKHKKKK